MIKIAGIEKLSTIDYPNALCTVLFTAGCNMLCQYCHNADLIDFKGKLSDMSELLVLLEKRKKFIDAVCISGGEPCLQNDLYIFIATLKEKGFRVKIDTNGTRPDVLKNVIDDSLVDYIAMDIKAPFADYNRVTGVLTNIENIQESIGVIMSSGLDYEFRTTVCRPLIEPEDIIEIADYIKGAKRYYIQRFKERQSNYKSDNTLVTYNKEELEEIIKQIKDWFGVCEMKG